MFVVGTAIAIGAIAADRHKRKKKLRNMSIKEREEFERYERAQQRMLQQQQMSQQGYAHPSQQQYAPPRQLCKLRRAQEAATHSQTPSTDKSSRMNYNREGRAANRQDHAVPSSSSSMSSLPPPPPTPQRNKQGPRVQQHVQSMLGDNDVYDPPPKYTP